MAIQSLAQRNRPTTWAREEMAMRAITEKIMCPPYYVNRNHSINQGLVGWWLALPGLDGGKYFYDIMNFNVGTLTNGPTWQGPKNRQGGYGSLSTSTTSYISTTLTTAVIPLSGTITFWMWPNNSASSGVKEFCFGCDDGAGTGIGFQHFTDDNLYVGWLNSSTDYRCTLSASTAGWTQNTWQMWTLTWINGSGSTLYRNVTQIASHSGLVTPGTGSAAFLLATSSNFLSNCFSGLMDDIRLYNRALFVTEVYALYDQTRQGHQDTLSSCLPKRSLTQFGTGVGVVLPSDPIGRLPNFSEQTPFGTSFRNDLQVVADPDAGGYIGFYSSPSGNNVYYRTASILTGTWSSESTAIAGVEKPYILVDIDGTPSKVSSSYHMYVITSGNSVTHYTASTLTGTWTVGSTVLTPPGGSVFDGLAIKAVSALYDSGTIYLHYMGLPASSDATYDYASRIGYATSTAPDSGFSRQGVILNPSITLGDWDYGWLGGFQIRRRSGGGYFATYNASNTRSVGSAGEPASSRFGLATASTITGTWTKDTTNNPYGGPLTAVTGIPYLEDTNVWRVYAYPISSDWLYFTNVGQTGTEFLTYASTKLHTTQWSQEFSDSYVRSNGAVSNSWTDVESVWSISSNTLRSGTISTLAGLYRPIGEILLNCRIDHSFTWPSSGNLALLLLLRVANATTANRTCYQVGFFGGGSGGVSFDIKRCVSGSESSSLANQSISVNSGDSVKMEFSARDKGDGTTDLYFSFVNNTQSSRPIFNLQVNDSTGSGLQSSGRQGLGIYNPSGITLIGSETKIYNLST